MENRTEQEQINQIWDQIRSINLTITNCVWPEPERKFLAGIVYPVGEAEDDKVDWYDCAYGSTPMKALDNWFEQYGSKYLKEKE